PRRKGAQRRPPQPRRRLLLQGLMRPILVVVLAEAVEALLLLGSRPRRRLRRLGFQRTMHALVAAVVLRRGRRNVARLDAELQPPHRQRREPAGSGRAERRAVVGAYRRRQANMLENPLQSASDTGPRRIDDAHLYQKAARLVGDRQRVAARPVGSAEPALEVDRPFIIGIVRWRH